MKNRNFYALLRQLKTKDGRGYTVSLMATELNYNRSRLTDTLNNKPGHGGQTRKRVIGWLTRMAGLVDAPNVEEFLNALGWNEQGDVVSPIAAPLNPVGVTCST